jgi:hypothetical protein
MREGKGQEILNLEATVLIEEIFPFVSATWNIFLF